MEKNDSKEILFSILGIFILVILVIGVSFAAFSFSQTGEKTNTITTGIISMTYSEPNNGINLVNALPITDKQGKVLSGTNNVFDFTVDTTINGTGNTTINYAITGVSSNSTVDDSAIKIYLTNMDDNADSEILAPTKISSLTTTTGNEAYKAPSGEFILSSGTMNSSSSHKYRLRMWVADDYTDATGGSYALKVNVYGAAAAL